MTRYILAILIVAGIVYAVYRQGGEDALQSERETTLEREKEIGDAIRSCSDLPWRERLQCNQ